MNKLIKGKTLSEKAYDVLREMILQMEPGNNCLPSEDDLARSMGVSRATIREALKYLMMDGVTTTIHGRGTFAHPSVFSVPNRLDLCSDFMMMLAEQYENVSVETKRFGYDTPTAFYQTCFGSDVPQVFAMGWLYKAEERPMLYGHFEICPNYLAREPKDCEDMISLPKFSTNFMKQPIDYCSMSARMGKCAEAQERLGLSEDTFMLYWEEKIYDIEDHLVATGTVYVHPTNMELSVVTHFAL